MSSKTEIVTEAQIRKELMAFCEGFPSFKLAAANLKITPSQLSLTLRGKVNVIPAKVLKRLKLKAAIVYTRPVKNVSPTDSGSSSSEDTPAGAPDMPARGNPIRAERATPGGAIHINLADKNL